MPGLALCLAAGMKSGRLLAPSALFLSACFVTMAQAVVPVNFYVWTGIGNGWKNQTLPPNDGSAALVFGNFVRDVVPIPGDFTVNSLHFFEDERMRFVSATPGTPYTLTINNGVDASEEFFTRANFSSDLTINVAQSQTWHFGGSGAATIHGRLAGTGDLTILGSGQPALILDNRTSDPSATPSTYSGNLVLTAADAFAVPTLAVWGNHSLGTGSVTFTNGGLLSIHGAPNLANNLVFGTGPLHPGQTAPNPIRIRVWDAPTGSTGHLTGSITLANHTTIQPINGFLNNRDSHQPNNTGTLALPGPITRHPVVMNGTIGDGGNGYGLHVTGNGVLILAGTSTYTGGTYVGFPVGSTSLQGGSLVFGSLAALPGTGPIQSGLLNTSNSSGYVGIAVSAVETAGSFASHFLSRISPTSSGAVGLDTLPGQATATFNDDIYLGAFNGTAANGIRLGTATTAILGPNSTIFPQIYHTYHFGNGGGTLFVQTPLNDIDGTSSLVLSNTGAPLKVVLQGNNTYTGDTTVANGILVFDNDPSVPSDGVFRAGGASNLVGQSYLGIGAVDWGITTFLGKFDKPNTWGIIGFDGRIEGGNIDLTGFNDGVYLGTASTATLTGTLKPSTVTNGNNAANTLRFTAADGGTLTIDSQLTDLQLLEPPSTIPVGVVIGVPVPPTMSRMSDGTVVLAAANTYTGGTTIHGSGGISVAVGHNFAFGAGAVTLSSAGGAIGLSATTTGINLANDFAFQTPTNGGTPTVFFTGSNNFTLSGDISGPGWSNMTGQGGFTLARDLEVTLTGDNTGFSGFFHLVDGLLRFESNTATGKGVVRFSGPGGIASFNSSGNAPNPVVYGIDGDEGTVHLAAGTNLTINLDNPNGDYDFGGVITGAGGPVNASLTITGSGIENTDDFVYLFGNNQYTGGTTITGQAALGLGHSNAAGSGPITINAVDGGLAINADVTLTNPLTLTAGGLAGLGTFAPTSFNGNVGGPIVIGANHVVLPGIPSDTALPGTLTFAANTVFNNGGTFEWLVMDPTDPEAFSLLNITGTLDLTTLSTGGFTLELESVSPDGEEHSFASSIVWGQPYTLRIISAAGGVLGFEAADFTFDVDHFQLGLVPLENFAVTADANNIYLSFTAVPEPSTWALMITGAAFLGLTCYRRRTRG